MPELPEVETIKNDLILKIKGKEIVKIKILWKDALNVSVKKFTSFVKNARISDISRRAKILIITLSNNYSLLIHLKMTGQLIYKPRIVNYKPQTIVKNSFDKYTRAIFFFTDKSVLFFNDLRKFGYIKLIPQNRVKETINNEKFGPEPMEKYFILKKFNEILNKHLKRRIKQFLTDPKIIAGIGNIYADEICFYAKVTPLRLVGGLNNKEINLIFNGIKKILSRAVEMRGSSVENYVDTDGQKGNYVKELKVYARKGKKCFRCSGLIKRIKLGGRSTHFCPNCQK